jgi:hypothetical protein
MLKALENNGIRNVEDRRLHTDDLVHLLGDGAARIRSLRHAVFPHSRYTLDLYHLKHNAHLVLPERHAKRFISLVLTGLPRTAIDYLNHIQPMDQDHAVELRQFREYVNNNRDGLHYRRGELNGSDVIEKMAGYYRQETDEEARNVLESCKGQ